MVTNRDNGYRVLMFSASWCGKCRDFKDLVDIRCVEHYDVDLDEAFASTYDIAMLPTFVLEHADGREQKRLVQPKDKATVYQWYKEITGEDLVRDDEDDDDDDKQ